MRHSLQVLAALLLAAVFAAPVAAATPGGAAEETLSGIVETAIVELGDARDHFQYTLRSGHEITPLDFERGDPGVLAGSRVTVTGTRVHDALHVASASPSAGAVRIRQRGRVEDLGAWQAETRSTTTAGGGTTQATTDGSVTAKSIAVVLFNFTDLQTTPFSKTQVLDSLANSSTSAKGFFEEESNSRMTVSGAAFGWYTIDATTSGCNWTSWTTLAYNAATAAGVSLDAYTNVMFAFPNTSACGWAGLGYVPGKYTYLNGNIGVQVMTHELGHNFGLGHSNADNCVVGGSRVMIAAPASCTSADYADPFSTMGNNALRHNHGSHLGELGWLNADEKTIAVPGNSYLLTPYFGGTGLKLVRVPRGDGSFFDLDVRTPYGAIDSFAAGSPVVAGVSVRLGWGTASPTTSPKATMLLDATPGTSSLSDAPLAVGRTMTDPVSKLSITTMSIETGGILVRVRDGNTPTAPGSLGAAAQSGNVALSWTAATDDTSVTGYRVSRDGSLLGTAAAGSTTWTDAAAAAGATYTYAVAAVDGSANTGPAASTSFTVPGTEPAPSPVPSPTPAPTPSPSPAADPSATPAPTPSPDPTAPPTNDAQAPSAPARVTGEATTTTVALAWTPASDDTGVVGYRVLRDGQLVASPGDVTWKDTARRPDTTYTYAVAALDGVGNVSSETTVTVTTLADTTGPTWPGHFHRVSRSGTHVRFDWSPSTDNVGVVRYRVYRVGRSTPVAVTRLSQVRIRTVRGASYYVRAIDAAGNLSPRSASVRGRR